MGKLDESRRRIGLRSVLRRFRNPSLEKCYLNLERHSPVKFFNFLCFLAILLSSENTLAENWLSLPKDPKVQSRNVAVDLDSLRVDGTYREIIFKYQYDSPRTDLMNIAFTTQWIGIDCLKQQRARLSHTNHWSNGVVDPRTINDIPSDFTSERRDAEFACALKPTKATKSAFIRPKGIYKDQQPQQQQSREIWTSLACEIFEDNDVRKKLLFDVKFSDRGGDVSVNGKRLSKVDEAFAFLNEDELLWTSSDIAFLYGLTFNISRLTGTVFVYQAEDPYKSHLYQGRCTRAAARVF